MSDTTNFLAWALRTTPKKIGKMHISQLVTAWLEAKLPPVTVGMTDNKTGKFTPLFELGQAERTKPKASQKPKRVARPKSR